MTETRTASSSGTQRAADPEVTSKHRLTGIDITRGVAVLGMFAAHFNPYQLDPDD